MASQVFDYQYQFADRDGRSIQLWVILYKGRLFNVTFAVSPHWVLEKIDFRIHEAA